MPLSMEPLADQLTQKWPKITIITPSFNQGRFLEATIRSVLSQDYPNLEYIIIDGGSSDDSVSIIQRYESQLAYWVSEPDRGQAHAINKGLSKATGEIVAWLNSDDLYLPGALQFVGTLFAQFPECHWLAGKLLKFGGAESSLFTPIAPAALAEWLEFNPVGQPNAFWRRSLTTRHGALDENYRYCMDYEFWLRLAMAGEKCCITEHPLAAFRLHSSSKTVAEANGFEKELEQIRSRCLDRLPPDQRQRCEAHFLRREAQKRYVHCLELSHTGRRREAWGEFLRIGRRFPRSLVSRFGIGCLRRLLFG